MKRGTILMVLGVIIIALVAAARFYVGTFNFSMLVMLLAGLFVAGLDASQRWERAKP
ncbi:hypothetical protein NCCP2145_38700 [Pseudarthrobacter sp. NCCP-2145]|nr:hypothetical protein NCCP2145_38700 [Pseudarthrobacter sp. NCCP-2145]